MSGLYCVVAKHSGKDQVKDGRYVLTFASRYVADEFYRALSSVVRVDGKGAYFSMLERKSAQFWLWTSSNNNPHDLHRVQEVPKLASSIDRDIRHSVISCMIPNTNQTSGGVVEMVGPIVEGQDWISGRKFFIRSKRHPDVYWWVHDNHVHASPHQRTKFQIERVADAKENQQGELVMIRSDKVTVKVLGVAPSTTPGGERKPAAPRYLRAACLNTRVEVSDVEHTWEFGKLVNGDVGIYWEDGDTSGGAGQARPFVVWTPDGEGDEWELV